MSKAPSPLLGYNNNVRHKNRMFHVQTEDSGVKHPHIITHLFMDGGRILKSVKKSYAEHVGTDGMSDVVRNMMKEQHKEMLIALRDGQYDHLVDPKAAAAKAAAQAAAAAAPGTTPEASPAPTAAKSPSVRPPSARPPSVRPGPPSARPGPPSARPGPPSARPAPPSASAGRPASVRPPPVSGPVISTAKSQPFEDAPATTRTPATRTSSQELTLDIDALERASKDDTTSPMFEPKNDLPPPPQNLLRDKSVTGGYRTLTPSPDDQNKPLSRPPPPSQQQGQQQGRRPPTMPPPKKPGSAPPPKTGSSPPRQIPPFSAKPPGKPPASRPGEGRYAPARPAAIFGPPARPQQAPSSSLFGEDLISDKSLDEVILSYLAEDLEPNDKKKR